MADAERAFERMVVEDFFQIVQLSRGPRHRELIASRAAYGDSSRIVAAVFEAPQSLDNDRDDLFWTDIANNAAHVKILRHLAPVTEEIFPARGMRPRSASRMRVISSRTRRARAGFGTVLATGG